MWAIIVLAGLLLLFVLLLSVPLEIAGRLELDGKPRFKSSLVWLFGRVRWELKGGKKGKEKAQKPQAEKAPKGGGLKTGTVLQVLRTRGLVRELCRLGTGTVRCFKVKELKADLRVGLDDPAETALLFALAGPVTPFLPGLRLTPSFGEAALEGYLYGVVRLTPIRLSFPFFRFIFSRPGRQVARTLILARWKQKR